MRTFISILLVSFLLSCSSSNTSSLTSASDNKVALLKVDYLTNTFEGGTVLDFPVHSSFTLATEYQAPGDFGGVQVYYAGLNEMIFDGSIVWAGLGERSFPQNLDSPADFQLTTTPAPQPSDYYMEVVNYDQTAFYPHVIDYVALWGAVKDLDVVAKFRANNPGEYVHLLLYTPSVGIGDPAEWDWYVMVKN
ncbi:MAG: hypothetical protein ACSHWW_05280 [Nonlabens sp.]|uniref:hypothetical protein n=1 Tax=Nonlabens sp. TaxID=1888209 RepID=UPI003EF2AD3B